MCGHGQRSLVCLSFHSKTRLYYVVIAGAEFSDRGQNSVIETTTPQNYKFIENNATFSDTEPVCARLLKSDPLNESLPAVGF